MKTSAAVLCAVLALAAMSQVECHTYYGTTLTKGDFTGVYTSYTHSGMWYWSLNVTTTGNTTLSRVRIANKVSPRRSEQIVGLMNLATTTFNGNGKFSGVYSPSQIRKDFAPLGDLKDLQGHICMGHVVLSAFLSTGEVNNVLEYQPGTSTKTCEEQALRSPPPPGSAGGPPQPPMPPMNHNMHNKHRKQA